MGGQGKEGESTQIIAKKVAQGIQSLEQDLVTEIGELCKGGRDFVRLDPNLAVLVTENGMSSWMKQEEGSKSSETNKLLAFIKVDRRGAQGREAGAKEGTSQ